MAAALADHGEHHAPLLFLWFYFTVRTALSLMNPAVVAVIVVLPTARPVATPRSVIVAFEELLLSHTKPGVPTTVTGNAFRSGVFRRLPSWPK